MPAQDVADFGFRGMRIALQIIRERHQNARRAEAALQSMIVAKRLLQRIERAVWARERFHGLDRAAFGLDRKRQTRAGGDAVDQHGASAADAVLAADMGAGRAQRMTEKIAKECA